jgi:hypothetical protein
MGWLGLVALPVLCVAAGQFLPDSALLLLVGEEAALFVGMVAAFWLADYPRIARARLSRDGPGSK